MNLSPQLQRALVLQQQGRHEQAAQEVRQHLATEPDDGFAHALLAVNLVHQNPPEEEGEEVQKKRLDQAEESARLAISQAPDMSFAHYAMAKVQHHRNNFPAATAAILEAIRLDPTEADFHGTLAGIEYHRERWREALASAEQGLQFDPEHVLCNNLRAMSLVKLGRKAEAGETIRAALARDPDDALSHANLGWTLLEQGKRKEALHHFRESLRLDPENDWARSGMVEALKAGNPVYAVMLKYFLWMQKLSPGMRWGILLGGYFGNRLLGGLAKSHPEWEAWILPLRVLYVVFALLTWLASPLCNLLLLLHPFGRHALEREQRTQAFLVGGCLAMGLGALGLGFIPGAGGGFLLAALVFGLLALPVSAIHSCRRGWPRNTMTAIALALAVLGVTGVALTCFVNPPKQSPLGSLTILCFSGYFLGLFASQWVAIWLSSVHPKK